MSGKGFPDAAHMPLFERFEHNMQRFPVTPGQRGNTLTAITSGRQAFNVFVQRSVADIGDETIKEHLLPDFINLLARCDMPLKATAGMFFSAS